MKKNIYAESISILQELKKDHPAYTMGQHIAVATAEFGDVAYISDKDMYTSLKKYRDELELDNGECDDIERIVNDGKNLSSMFSPYKNEEEDEYGG